jgi:hypothetical protein
MLLGVPLLLWFSVRLAAFGSVAGGVYALPTGMSAVVQRVLLWPFASDVLSSDQRGLALVHFASRLLKCGNLLVVALAAFLTIRGWRRDGHVPLAVLCFWASYAFVLLTGLVTRYGAVMDVFLILALLHWLSVGSWAARTCAAVVVACVAVAVALAALAFPEHKTSFLRMYESSRQYVTALRPTAPDARVLVLNDPATRHSRLEWLLQVMDIKGDVRKASDFPWGAQWFEPRPQCQVQLDQSAHGTMIRFRQSCGVEFSGSPIPAQGSVKMALSSWATTKVELGAAGSPPDSFDVTLSILPVQLVYYDPQNATFKSVLVAGR